MFSRWISFDYVLRLNLILYIILLFAYNLIIFMRTNDVVVYNILYMTNRLANLFQSGYPSILRYAYNSGN